MTWRRIDVAYHDPAPDHLVLATRPLFERGRGWFQRHWTRGPHLELWFATAAPSFDEVAALVVPYLREHPSRTTIDPDRLRPQHEHLAVAEQIDEPLYPFYENNTVHEAVPRSRVHVLGSAAAEELLHDFHVGASAAAFGQLEAADRLSLAFELMVATAHTFAEGGITGGFVSFRSHAEAFLAGAGPGVRERWDAQLAARARAVRGQVAAVSARGRAWTELLEPFGRRGDELIASGELTFDEGAVAVPDSEFHRVLSGNAGWHENVLRSAGFRRYRLLLNLTYLQLSRLGVTAVQRSLLCHFAASAVEQEYGVSAIEVAAGGV
ncbi:thiopeptide maturation pyridine synthase [Lentzea sp. NEAU-D7]|uniref:thiopeptide maturation pyridine synthase n=1 Tax=Lentzea sp. NEAU-D7 TaxID=2994667 RepID=UPI00224B93FF|nr:thiopeptide maturation pyridine synthase [Lentzea sp. NEAU-D7]MCX2951556.1 hypothetical protein [Lentzea sp. NEAU-D7]